MKKSILAVVLFLTPFVASASTVLGNPASGIVHVKGNPFYLHDVVLHPCAGSSQTVSMGVMMNGGLEPLSLPSDTFCSVDLTVQWAPGGSFEVVPVDGFDELKAVSGAPYVLFEVDSSDQTATLQ